MISIKEVRDWLDTLKPGACVAIDEGGLRLLEVLPESEPQNEPFTYLEVGGIPDDHPL